MEITYDNLIFVGQTCTDQIGWKAHCAEECDPCEETRTIGFYNVTNSHPRTEHRGETRIRKVTVHPLCARKGKHHLIMQ